MSYCEISEIIGRTMKSVTSDGDSLTFEDVEGNRWWLGHTQDCCESVNMDEIVGDLTDLEGSPILQAEEASNECGHLGAKDEWDDSYTWTFYKFATLEGYVTVRFYGTSNGYYSESVDFRRLT